MDQIKTSIDRIFDQYNTDNTIFAPDSSMNIQDYDSRSKKRKLSIENVSKNGSSIRDDSFCSLNSSQYVPPSPWQIRRLKADMVDSENAISNLKKELENRATSYANMESIYEGKVKDLQKQLESSTAKITDLDKHLKYVRLREAAQKSELVKLRSQCSVDKKTYDETIYDLQRSNKFTEGKCRQIEHEMGTALATIQKKHKDLEQNFSSKSDECNKLQDANNAMQEKIEQYAEISKQYANQQQELEAAQRKIKILEDEIISFGELKAMHQSLEDNSSKLQDMEKKNQRLQHENKELLKCIGNKLLLEEEVEHLKTRLAKSDKISDEIVSLNSKIPYIEQDLAAFKAISIDFCAPNVAPTAAHLRSRIDEILKKDLILISENGSIKMEKDAIAGQIDELKKQIATLTKTSNDLQNNLKDHKASFYRVQKKLRLVVTERDCYKQLIENYEKNVTISMPASETGADTQIRLRLEMLEKTVAGYKEMCASLEKELQSVKSSPDHVEPFTNEQYKKIRKELDSLREDNERLRRRKDELELLFEHSNMKEAYNIQKYKVMHMAINPADQTYENHKNEIEKLQAEIERLKRKNRKLETDNEEFTAANLTFDIKEVNNLRAQIKSLEGQKQHIADSYRTNINEFRDACYLLFGFKVDKQHGNIYRLSSMYAESPDEYLTFKMSDDSDISLMESAYSNSINDFIEKTLMGPNSIPVFLSSLTIDLFNRTTMV